LTVGRSFGCIHFEHFDRTRTGRRFGRRDFKRRSNFANFVDLRLGVPGEYHFEVRQELADTGVDNTAGGSSAEGRGAEEGETSHSAGKARTSGEAAAPSSRLRRGDEVHQEAMAGLHFPGAGPENGPEQTFDAILRG
jgi:hypothetical protein